MSYVVVLMTASPCPEDERHHCVMEVHGPFPDRDTASRFADTYPTWTNPHLMMLQPVIPKESDTEAPT